MKKFEIHLTAMFLFKELYVISLFLCLTAPTYGSNLLTSYLPASMQALAYYIDLLQYEPISMTTVEPPFSVSVEEVNVVSTVAPTNFPKRNSTYGWQQQTWKLTSTTTTTAKPPTTPHHNPAIYAPEKLPGLFVGKNDDSFSEIGENSEGFDDISLSLIRDIQAELAHDNFSNEVESLDNFLRLYDDNYGRAAFDTEEEMDRWSSTSTAGKKRTPPTKPYVEFLLIYDLLKRDAKAANLSKFEGYSEEILKELHELSKGSSVRQLHTLLKRMLDRHDIKRSDVVSRIKVILKDLGNPDSATSKELRFIPAMPFLP